MKYHVLMATFSKTYTKKMVQNIINILQTDSVKLENSCVEGIHEENAT